MRFRHKKLFISGIAVTVAGVLGIGALLQTSVSVQASSAMMPGIEEIVKDASSDSKPFRILEIVDHKSEAEIGYYISGQEPYIKLYQYQNSDADDENGDNSENILYFSSLDDGLSKIKDAKTRKEFATNKKYDENGEEQVDENGNPVTTGIKDISYAVNGTDASETPLSFSEYQESYFKNPGDWKEIKFKNPDGSSRTEEVEVRGQYQQNTEGTGDYTKQEQTYYPIRENTDDKTNEADKFRENIQNFFYSEGDGAAAPYYLEFEKISNSWLNEQLKTKEGQEELSWEYNYSENRYGYYENVYSNLTTDLADAPASFPGENPEKPEGLDPISETDSLQEETQFVSATEEFSSDGSSTQNPDQAVSPEGANDADSFGSGVDDGSQTGSSSGETDTVPAANSGNADAEAAFSGGEFSDSQQPSDNAVAAGADLDVSGGQGTSDSDQGNVADVNADADTGTDTTTSTDTVAGADTTADPENGTGTGTGDTTETGTDTDAGTNADDKPKTLKKTSEDSSVGTAANPYVYVGTEIDTYPYYSYTALTDLKAAKKEAEENAKKQQEAEENNETYIPEEEAITIQDGQYYYWQVFGNDMVKIPVTIITGKQPVSYSDVLLHSVYDKLPYDYYYRVSKVYFCCKMKADNPDQTDPKNYEYYGWYYSSHPQGEDTYLPTDGNATYYISDAEYKLTPGTGDYDFVPGDGDGTKQYKVEIDRMYYTGGYKNNDWFKRYVFHLDPEENKTDFENFNIVVDTLETPEAEEKYGNIAGTDASESEAAQFSDSEFTDSETESSELFTDTSGADAQVSEVDPMVSEAGVELVSIEKEINDNTEMADNTDADDNIVVNDNTEINDSAEGNDNSGNSNGNDESESEGSGSETEVTENTNTLENADTAENDGDIPSSSQDFQDDSVSGGSEGNESEITAPEAEFTDVAGTQETVFSAGETQKEDSAATSLSDYDLIYINGVLSENTAKSLAAVVTTSSVPCIVNAVKAESDIDFSQKYAGFIKDDADGHYVNNHIYFFKNNLESGEHTGDLINLHFHEQFNSDAEITDGTDPVNGFEEILDYIEKENQYRKIGTTEDNVGAETPLLTTEISQARAIEYIINFKFKREVTYKEKVNVLELMPDGDSSQGITKDVYNWMGESASPLTKENVKIASVTACEWHIYNSNGTKDTTEPGDPGNVIDGNTKTIWHSPWEGEKDGNGKMTNWDGTQNHDGKGHYLTITLEDASDVSGFVYTPRQDGSRNGVLKTYSVEFFDISGNLLTDESISNADTGLTDNNFRATKEISFGKTIHNVKTIKLYFNETLAHENRNKNKFATCAELSFFALPEVTWADISGIDACHSQAGQGPENMLNSDLNKYWHSPWQGNEGTKGENGEEIWDGRTVHQGKGHYITITFKELSEINGFWYQARQDSTNGVLSKYTAEFYGADDELLDSASGLTGLDSSNYRNAIDVLFGKTVSNVKYIKLYFSGTLAVNSQNNNAFATCGQIKFFYVPNKYAVSVTSMTASEYVGHIDDINAEYDMIYIGDYVSKRNSYIVGPDPFLYVHVGDGKLITANNQSLFKLLGQLDTEYDQKLSSDGKRRFAPFNTYGENSGGYLRGSGNDMTAQNYEELMEFVKSGYPVVLGNKLVTEKRTVNPKTVDSSSYYYQFIQEALKYPNVMTKDELDSGKKDIMFWATLTKPVINFTKGGKPAEPPRKDESEDSGAYIKDELKFTFTISNDSDAVPATATYDCDLYLDLNFDGNFSDKEVQDKYIQITDEAGKVLSQVSDGSNGSRYELEAGKTYTLTRKIPEDYFKLITWKLEVSNNQNPYIHTSETGYSKQKNYGSKQKINVLQLVPNACTWNLTSDKNQWNYDAKFWNLVNSIEDFEIVMTTITVTDFNAMNREAVNELLDKQQMLIIGFADAYQNLDNSKNQVDEILSFIKQGKSVLFAHDTTSYLNFDYDQMYEKIADSEEAYDNGEGVSIHDAEYNNLKNNAKNVQWGYSLNKVLRTAVGMDRYGITSDDPFGKDGKPLSDLMKQGKALNSSEVSFKDLMEVAGDIAYQRGENRTKSYGQTQAYTNHLLDGLILGNNETTTVTKVNDGAITQYPYRMPDLINVAKTHGQWYQLALERDRDLSGQSDGKTDIVVWYCLSGSIYSASPNDVRNNYYFYSNKNVIYTGAGHKNMQDSVDDFERKLFINAMVAAANVTAVRPEVDFVKSLDPTSEIQTTKYYMTDQESWSSDERNTLEKNMDLYFNVKDYNMVSADLNPEDLKKQEMTVEFYIEDPTGTVLSGDDVPDELEGKRVTNLTGDISGLKAYKSKDEITIGKDGVNDGKFHLKQNDTYGFSIDGVEKYLRNLQNNGYYTNCKVYAVVKSTVYLYGTEKSETTCASIDLKERRIFDMD